MDTTNPTLCTVCNRVISRLLEVEHGGAKVEIRGPVQDFIRLPSTTRSKEERMRQCYVCNQMKRNSEDCDVQLRGNLEGELRFDLYYYKGTEHIGENFVTNTYFARRAEQDIYDIARDSILSTSTGSKKSQALISHWFNTCLHQHSRCRASGEEQWYPRRVLDVSGHKVRLLETAGHALQGPYATMSHCWGVKRFLTMTSENKPEFEAGIDLSILPRNFQDAITLTKSLEIRYIWIDCYCIMQSSDSDDHKKEKLLDIAQMKQVYANSILSIVASHGSSPEAGCFIEREMSKQLLPCLFSPESPSSDSENIFHLYNLLESQGYVRELNDHRIFSRAWILQERLLCPRVIHFGSKQLYWECKELLPASEKFPCGQKSQPATNVFSTEDEDLVKSARYTWCRTVQDYSAMQLTKPLEDKLVAIGGIAEHIAQVTKDQYTAGLFKDKFILQLCWEARGVDPRRAVEWRAPSWSWASMDSEVFLESHLLASSVYTALALIQTVNVELTDPMNPYGAIKSASAVLTGHPLPATLDSNRRKPESHYAYFSRRFFRLTNSELTNAEDSLEFQLDDPNNFNLASQHLYTLPVCMAFISEDDFMQINEAIEYPNEIQQHGTIHALLVERISSNQYIRQGCIMSFVSSNECLKYRDILQAWKSTPQEKIVLV